MSQVTNFTGGLVEARSDDKFIPARWRMVVNGGQQVEWEEAHLADPTTEFTCAACGTNGDGEPFKCKHGNTADKMQGAIAPDGSVLAVCSDHAPGIHQVFGVPTNKTLREILDTRVLPKLRESNEFHRKRIARRQQVSGLASLFTPASR